MKELITRTITGSFLILLLFTLLIFFPVIFSVLMAIFLICILIFEWPKIYNYNNYKFYFFTFFYPVLPFILIIILELNNYKIINFVLFTLVFAHDIGSYIIGKLFGKNKLWYRISPGKTWQGAIGGYILTIIVSCIIFKFNIKNLFIFILPFSFLVTLTALAGDLFESYLKRKSNIKDSGFFLPGHGGLLDRFDSILSTAYIIFLLKNYIIKFINLNF